VSEFTPPPQYAQYPRDQFQPSSEFDRPAGVYLDAIGDSWTIVKRDLGTWVAMFLVSALLAQLMSAPLSVVNILIQNGGTFIPQRQPEINAMYFVTSLFFGLLSSAISLPLQGGLLYVALKQVRGEQTEFGDLFKGFSHFLPLALFGVLAYLLALVATALCFIPVIFVIGILTPGTLLVMDRGLSPTEAVSEAVRVLGGKAWTLGLFQILVSVLMVILGLLMCCVGILVTIPVVIVFSALHYHYFWPRQVREAVLPL
jgi:uncharacterized membrane protein